MRAYNIERREATHLLQERYNETVKILAAVREAASVQHDSISSLSSSSSEEVQEVEEEAEDEAAELLQEQELSTTEEEAESEEDQEMDENNIEEIRKQLKVINGKLCNSKMLTLSRLTIDFNFSIASLVGAETR